MPNWCVGDLKIRGTKENLKSFCENELLIDGEKKGVQLELNEDDYCFYLKCENAYYLWIQGTRRHFIEVNGYDEYCCKYYDDEDEVMIILPMKAAWGIESEPLRVLSEKYHIDFRIKGYECGVGFTQEIEILDGEITLNEEQNYDDYIWECENPFVGG